MPTLQRKRVDLSSFNLFRPTILSNHPRRGLKGKKAQKVGMPVRRMGGSFLFPSVRNAVSMGVEEDPVS